MKTLRIAWWLANYQYVWWLPIGIILFGTVIGALIQRVEYSDKPTSRYIIAVDDQRTTKEKVLIKPTKEIKITQHTQGHDSIGKAMLDSSMDGVLTIKDSSVSLDYIDIIKHNGKSSEGMIEAVKHALDLTGIDSSDLQVGSAMEDLGFQPSSIERLTVLFVYVTFILTMTAGILKSIVQMRGAPTTEVLISGLGAPGVLHARMLELLIRSIRFWITAMITLLIIRGMTLHFDFALLAIVAQTPMWLIATAVIAGAPYALLVTSISISLASCGGRIFEYLKKIFILFVMLTTGLGAITGLATSQILTILLSTNQGEAYKVLEAFEVAISVCPFTSVTYLIAKMVQTDTIPPIFNFSLIITGILAVWCYYAAIKIFPTTILDTSIKCHWKKFIYAMLWPFSK